jgi:hypothetical protein
MTRLTRLVFAFASAALVMVSSRDARADDGETDKEGVEQPRPYGWQTLLVDAGAAGLFLGGVFHGETRILEAGAAAYALGPPLVHVAHGHVGRAGADAAIRVLGPPVVGAIGFGLGLGAGVVLTGNDPEARIVVGGLLGYTGLVVGAIGGYVAAVAVDAAVLAQEPARKPAVALAPTLDLGRGRASVGIGGAF